MSVLDALGLRSWRRALTADARGRVLEIGCGTGLNLGLYGPEARIVGLDVDRRALARAHKRAPGVPLVVGNAESLPFRAQSFDVVVSSLVFCSVEDPGRGLREVRRVLHFEGELRMLEHVRDPRPAVAAVQDFLQPLWTKLTGGCHPNRDTLAMVEVSGFRIEQSGRGRRVLRLFRARPRFTANGRVGGSTGSS